MIHWLLRIGALYAAYKLGEAGGRAQARADMRLQPPLDYERLPSDRNEAEFGELT
ncbi:hypothetical protein [Mesorhizobium sp. NZP2298]|uniref:hypothetical protein n=1 Tax=Mesorhizobium sp. NZP2298 TaxID=2483403 RepID=UPI0015525D3F|nr:hypothetical protein [Mesorhizobium sp. NZP2298]